MGELSETDLPGVGIRYDMRTGSGRSMGVVVHHTGRRDLVVYDERDPDSVAESLALSEDEAHTIGEILGGSRVVERIEEAILHVEDLVISWVKIDPASPVAGLSLADAAVPATTGASLVAFVSQSGSRLVPGGEDILNSGDTAVVVGSPEAIEAVTALLSPGS